MAIALTKRAIVPPPVGVNGRSPFSTRHRLSLFILPKLSGHNINAIAKGRVGKTAVIFRFLLPNYKSVLPTFFNINGGQLGRELAGVFHNFIAQLPTLLTDDRLAISVITQPSKLKPRR